HVIARIQEMRDRVLPGHPGCEREAPGAGLERGEAGLERLPGRIVRAGIVEALVLADGLLRERARLEDRHRDRAGRRFRVLASVDRGRLEALLAEVLPHRLKYG